MNADISFPVLTFEPYEFIDSKPGDEHVECISDAKYFWTLHASEGRGEGRIGMVVVGNDGRCWKVLSVTAGGIAWSGPWPIKLLRSLFGMNRRHANYELLELPPMSLDQVKDKVVEIIMQRPDSWWDDEAIAGEDGEPREAEEMIDELIARVRNATSMLEVSDVVEYPHGPGR